MFKSLEIFKVSHAMARHAATRQSVIARNMANADTPSYAAKDVSAFKEIVDERRDTTGLQATRAKHLHGTTQPRPLAVVQAANIGDSPNGNGVSLEEEMMKSVDTKRQHDRAIAIYKSSLGVLRTTLGRR
ncbi:flagellar basal-body rod protein FlgB [Salinihabitans flavidus]|uniref:Flagellar basal-body rod protein FlgB n=1 Tax=Salinihabitans flavidus TaxID=569882 RepID=A0A1H8LQ07_9RHOB|nr:FlgB family protein [Salinihabitans flavidus]SEO07199.1 flagellar basal-body rod protein FlgB [Salinihabitans flavidus]